MDDLPVLEVYDGKLTKEARVATIAASLESTWGDWLMYPCGMKRDRLDWSKIQNQFGESLASLSGTRRVMEDMCVKVSGRKRLINQALF